MEGRFSPAFPQVSVVTPTYNRAAVVGRAITSVLNQTFSDLECIVVDDGSTDQTVPLVEGFQDPRLRLVRLPANGGPSLARNVGIQAACGELIAFLDSDDEWLPQKLELQVKRMQEAADPRVAVIYCLCSQYDGATDRMKPHSTVIHEGDVFERLLYAEDYDLWLRLAEMHNHFLAVSKLLVNKYENRGPQLSSDPFARFGGMRLLDRKWRPAIKRHLGSAGYRRWRARRDRFVKGFLRARPNKYDTVSGNRVPSWRWFLLLVRFLPWSRRYLIHGLVLLILGHRVYETLWRIKKTLDWRGGGHWP